MTKRKVKGVVHVDGLLRKIKSELMFCLLSKNECLRSETIALKSLDAYVELVNAQAEGIKVIK